MSGGVWHRAGAALVVAVVVALFVAVASLPFAGVLWVWQEVLSR